MTIFVHNLRTDTMPANERHVYVGRANNYRRLKASPLANPYHLTGSESRSLVLMRYEQWLAVARQREPQRIELHRLTELARTGDVHLYCWCAPELCHADIIREAISRQLQEASNAGH